MDTDAEPKFLLFCSSPHILAKKEMKASALDIIRIFKIPEIDNHIRLIYDLLWKINPNT